MTDAMVPVSRVVELFGGTGPGEGRDPYMGGGGYPEQVAGAAGRTVYYPGGSATLGDLNQALQAAGPKGMVQAGGARPRKSRKSRKSRKQRKSRKSRVKRRSF